MTNSLIQLLTHLCYRQDVTSSRFYKMLRIYRSDGPRITCSKIISYISFGFDSIQIISSSFLFIQKSVRTGNWPKQRFSPNICPVKKNHCTSLFQPRPPPLHSPKPSHLSVTSLATPSIHRSSSVLSFIYICQDANYTYLGILEDMYIGAMRPFRHASVKKLLQFGVAVNGWAQTVLRALISRCDTNTTRLSPDSYNAQRVRERE